MHERSLSLQMTSAFVLDSQLHGIKYVVLLNKLWELEKSLINIMKWKVVLLYMYVWRKVEVNDINYLVHHTSRTVWSKDA